MTKWLLVKQVLNKVTMIVLFFLCSWHSTNYNSNFIEHICSWSFNHSFQLESVADAQMVEFLHNFKLKNRPLDVLIKSYLQMIEFSTVCNIMIYFFFNTKFCFAAFIINICCWLLCLLISVHISIKIWFWNRKHFKVVVYFF